MHVFTFLASPDRAPAVRQDDITPVQHLTAKAQTTFAKSKSQLNKTLTQHFVMSHTRLIQTKSFLLGSVGSNFSVAKAYVCLSHLY